MNKSVKRRTRRKKLRRSKKINKHSNKTKRKSISKTKRKRRKRRSSRVKKGGFNHFYVPPFNLEGLTIGNDTITSPLKLNETVAKFMDNKCI